MAVSYMPQVLDAVPNNDRQSAPKDYAAWEALCFQATQHSLQRVRPESRPLAGIRHGRHPQQCLERHGQS